MSYKENMVAESATTTAVMVIQKGTTQHTQTETNSRSWLLSQRTMWLQRKPHRRQRKRKRTGAEDSLVVATKAAPEAKVEEIIRASIQLRSREENITSPRFINCKNNAQYKI